MIYDCFIFYNELDLLELRLAELSDVVDSFVLVEATRTISDEPKPLFFDLNRERFAAYESRIRHVVVGDMPSVVAGNRRPLEVHQRSCITRGLEHCGEDDLILISDVDEIPRPGVVREMAARVGETSVLADCLEARSALLWALPGRLRASRASLVARVCRRLARLCIPSSRVFRCYQRHCEYYLNGYVQDTWRGTVGVRYSTFASALRANAQTARQLAGIPHRLIPHGGWHFTYLGGAERVAQKLHAFSHGELDTPEYTDLAAIQSRIERGENLFGRTGDHHDVKYVEIGETWPRCVVENPERWKEFIRPVPPPVET